MLSAKQREKGQQNSPQRFSLDEPKNLAKNHGQRFPSMLNFTGNTKTRERATKRRQERAEEKEQEEGSLRLRLRQLRPSHPSSAEDQQ